MSDKNITTNDQPATTGSPYIRQRVTLLIWQDGKWLVIRRQRNGRSYLVIPGGGVEEGETIDEAALREAMEETSLHITLGPQLWTRPFVTPIEDGEEIHQIEYAYLITHFSGEPRFGEAEYWLQTPDNQSELVWLTQAEIEQMPIYPGPLPPNFWQTEEERSVIGD